MAKATIDAAIYARTLHRTAWDVVDFAREKLDSIEELRTDNEFDLANYTDMATAILTDALNALDAISEAAHNTIADSRKAQKYMEPLMRGRK